MTTLAHKEAIDFFVENKDYQDKNFSMLLTAYVTAINDERIEEFYQLLNREADESKTKRNIQQRTWIRNFLKSSDFVVEILDDIKDFKRIPDCFKFTDYGIEVLEIFDTSKSTKQRLTEYAVLDEYLYSFFGHDIRLKLFEYSCTFKSKIEHDLSYLYEDYELTSFIEEGEYQFDLSR